MTFIFLKSNYFNLFFSISMTAISTTLGLGMMPLLLYIYSFGFGNNLKVPFQTIGSLQLLLYSFECEPLIKYFCVRRNYTRKPNCPDFHWNVRPTEISKNRQKNFEGLPVKIYSFKRI